MASAFTALNLALGSDRVRSGRYRIEHLPPRNERHTIGRAGQLSRTRARALPGMPAVNPLQSRRRRDRRVLTLVNDVEDPLGALPDGVGEVDVGLAWDGRPLVALSGVLPPIDFFELFCVRGIGGLLD